MQIVIDIDEELYKEYVNIDIRRGNGKSIVYTLLKAIKNGTPLPKHHGRLIDADALNFNANYNEPLIHKQDIDDAPTIIEADKEVNADE